MIEASAQPGEVLSAHSVDVRHGFPRYTRLASMVAMFGYSLGYSTIGFALLFVGTLWSLVARRTFPWTRTSLDFPLAAFGAVLMISAAASPYHRLALGVTLMLLISGAVYLGSFAWLMERDPASRATLLRVWAAGSFVAALVGLTYSATHYVETWPPGTFVHARAEIPHGVGPNGLGTTLLLGSILGLGFAFRTRRWERLAWTTCGLLSLLGLLATGSRASVAGWIVGSAYLVYRELRLRPRMMAAILAGGAAALVLASVGTPQLMGRLQHTITDVSGNRVRIWRTSFGMIRARPLLGTGFGTFQRDYERHKAPGMSSEPFAFNLILNLAAETGMVGLAAAASVAAAAVRVWRSRGSGAPSAAGPFQALVAALWIGLLVDQSADNTVFSIATSAAIWALLALVVV